MNAVNNMRLLEGSSDTKKNSIGAFSLKFDVHKKHAARKNRTGEEVMWQLSQFYPMIEELVEKLSKGEIPKNYYPCMNDPSPTFHGSSGAASNPTNPTSAPHSMRQRRATWARPRASDNGYPSFYLFDVALLVWSLSCTLLQSWCCLYGISIGSAELSAVVFLVCPYCS